MRFMEALLANPDFIGTAVSLILGLFSLGVFYLKRTLTQLKSAHEKTRVDVERAAIAAESASEQVSNPGGRTLSDNIDRMETAIEKLQFSVDESDARNAQWREEHARQHDEERRERAQRDTRAEKHLDMLRRDVQGLTERSAAEHQLLHDRITKMKQENSLD